MIPLEKRFSVSARSVNSTFLLLVAGQIRLALLCYLSIALALLGGLTRTAHGAVGFTVTPAAVSNTYSGEIVLQITGLTNTESVVIQKFLDLNANGVIDGGDWLLQQFKLTDGQAGMVIGGVTNLNVPGDLNATSGAVTASLKFRNGDFAQTIAGRYLFELSSAASHFTPLTNQFAVTNFPFAQEITGKVVSDETGAVVPNAVLVLSPAPTAGEIGPETPLAGVVANNAGSYAIRMPPGTYVPIAFSGNYVFNYLASPVLTLASGQTINTNLTLTHATASISGKVADASNASTGLPGGWVYAFSTNRLIGFTYVDSSGNFNMRVTAGDWALGRNPSQLSIHGYVGSDNDDRRYSVGAGATGVTLAYPKATALFYGSVKDDLGNPVPGVAVEDRKSVV